jgi:hypothetical protein
MLLAYVQGTYNLVDKDAMSINTYSTMHGKNKCCRISEAGGSLRKGIGIGLEFGR